MEKLEITNKNNYAYMLKDENGISYTINMDFWDIDKQPEVGEIIYINKELLSPNYEGYSSSYTFGNLENKYGKENIVIDDIDIIKIVLDEKEIYLKRLYG